jgi:hypothetical protein
MAEEMRTESGVIINVFIAVHIPDPGSLTSGKGNFRFDPAIDRNNATGDIVLIFFQEFL